MLIQEPGDDLESPRSIMMEVDVMTGVRVQIRNERLSIAIKVSCRLLEDTLAFAVADDVVFFACNCLRAVSMVLFSVQVFGLTRTGP